MCVYVCMYVVYGNWGLITINKTSQIIWSTKKNQGIILSYSTVKQGIYSEEHDLQSGTENSVHRELCEVTNAIAGHVLLKVYWFFWIYN